MVHDTLIRRCFHCMTDSDDDELLTNATSNPMLKSNTVREYENVNFLSIKSGYLTKEGGGTSKFVGRKSLKQRWFVLDRCGL